MLRLCVFLSLFVFGLNHVEAWSLQTVKQDRIDSTSSRRGFFSALSTTLIASGSSYFGRTLPANAASPQVFTTPSGIKYATIKPATGKGSPQDKDIVAIEYTGYLTDGTIFDSTHAEGKQKALVFEVGGNAVIQGINEMVKEMEVGQKVQAIIPPQLAFGDKGICVDSGECLVKPKSFLVYDIYLKRSAIPPP